LFQPFNRLGRENTVSEGTGIGLVMTKRLIELMGGEIGVESTLGRGSCFWVELNLADAPEQVKPPSYTPPPLLREPVLRQHLILYVEDNPANLPGINGIRVLEILRADARTANIPVVALSANAMPRDIDKGIAAGFFRYLTKPIVIAEFMTTLDQALEQ